jgi:glycosyltransferase involved in cell wall biosynthesis
MRLALVSATFPPYQAGTGLVCYHNALGLARRGHDVTVFTAADASGTEGAPVGVRVRRLAAPFRVGNAPLLPGLLGLRGFDLIHLHSPFISGAELTWAASKLWRTPYVLTHHNDLIGDGWRRLAFDAYSAASLPLVFGGARRLIAVSRDHAAGCRLRALFQRRWSATSEVPNGVDADLFRVGVDGAPLRRRLGLSASTPVLLLVAALDRAHHFKGVEHLLAALGQMRERRAHLIVAGDGDLRVRYEAQARALGLGERVSFVGGVSHQVLPELYAAADLAVLPSFPPESFGMVLIEAMACGRAVVAHRLPGVRSVVRDGLDGLLVTPGDLVQLVASMDALLADPERRREMGENGRARVEATYTWPRVIEQLERTYQEALGPGQKRSPAAHSAVLSADQR